MPTLKSDSRYDKDKTAFVAFKRDWTGSPYNGSPALFVVWDTTKTTGLDRIEFRSDTVDTSLRTLELSPGSYSSAYIVGTGGSLSNATYNSGGGGFSDLNCVSVAQKVIYSASWTQNGGQTFPGVKESNLDPGVQCAFYDFVCWMGDFSSWIVDSLQHLWDGIIGIFERLIQFLTGLFVPSDENIFKTGFSDINTYLHYKLGFLTYPFDFVATQVSALMTIVNSDNKNEWHNTSLGGGAWTLCANNILGNSPLCINPGALEYEFPQLWAAGIFFLRLAVAVSLVELMRNKYMSVVKG